MSEPVHRGHGDRPRNNWSSINQWLLWIGLAAAVAWLFFRHNAHLLQLLPFLFVLACPLMHLFGHGGHGGHDGHRTREGEGPEAPTNEGDRSGGPPRGHAH
jgi:hypothetical protein